MEVGGSVRRGVLRFVCFPASFTGRYHTFICISTPSFGDPHGNLYLTSACKLLLNIADINHAGVRREPESQGAGWKAVVGTRTPPLAKADKRGGVKHVWDRRKEEEDDGRRREN